MRQLLWISFLAGTTAFAQNPVTVGLEPFTLGLTNPVAIAHAGDARLFVVEQEGYIQILDAEGTVSPAPFLDIHTRVNSGGEQGLLGLAFDPNYSENGFFYVYYIFGGGNGSSRVSRFSVTANPDSAAEASEQVIYSWPQPYSNHNGGDIHFGPDGYLYIGFGDGGSGGDPEGYAQDLTEPLGDMIRIDVSDPDTTYTIPPTNPFAGMVGDTLQEIWASGLRNPFRWGFDALTGDLWIGDVGQNLYEEVDFWPAGGSYNSHPNFGWNCYEGLGTYSSPSAGCANLTNYVPPVAEHAQGAFGWYSVIGGRVYRGTEFPRLEGRYLYTDYVGGEFYSLLPDGVGGFVREEVRNIGTQGLACFGENNVGELFVGNVSSGTIFHLVDACPMAAPVILIQGEMLQSSLADAYAWYLNGNVVPGATSQNYQPEENGSYTVRATFGNCQLFSDPLVIATVGIVDPELLRFQMRPVPAKDELVLSQLPNGAELVRITDMTGRMVLEVSAMNIKDRLVLSVAELPNGNYVVSVLGRNGLSIQDAMLSVAH